MTKRRWPWTSIVAFIGFGIVMAMFLIAAAGEIALHRWREVIMLIVMLVFITCGSTIILLKLRDRYDYYIESDGRLLRRWSPAGEVAIRKEDLVGVEWGPQSSVVRGTSGEIAISRAYVGYGRLCRIVKQWQTSNDGRSDNRL